MFQELTEMASGMEMGILICQNSFIATDWYLQVVTIIQLKIIENNWKLFNINNISYWYISGFETSPR